MNLTFTTGKCGRHRDDGHDQIVEESCLERVELETAVANPRRGDSGGSQGIHGPGEFYF